jgi:4'-phosphopantetheinyl transferase
VSSPWQQRDRSSSRIAPSEVQVWSIRWEKALADLADLERLVGEAEITRAEAYRRADDRHRFLVGRAVLRILLADHLDRSPREVPVVILESGKPCLHPAENSDELQFNVSHSGKWILLVLARARQVGIDVEHIRTLELEPMVERCCSPRERDVFRGLADADRQAALFRCWVRKEAYMKGLGQGLRIPLDEIEVTFAPGEPARIERRWSGDTSQQGWNLRELQVDPEYAAAVAVEGSVDRLSLWDWHTHR